MTTPGLDLRGQSVLAVMAHPDDESLACGGLLALCARAGARVGVLSVTPGDYTDAGGAAAQERGTLRRQELEAAGRVLGVGDVRVMAYRDGYLPHEDAGRLERDISDAIAQWGATTVVTFDEDGLYWHPDHVTVHQRTTAAVARLGETGPTLYYVSMPETAMRTLVDSVTIDELPSGAARHVLGVDDPDAFGTLAPTPTYVLDVSAFAVLKLRALRCHASQVADGAIARVSETDAPRLLGIEHYRRAPQHASDTGVLSLLTSASMAR